VSGIVPGYGKYGETRSGCGRIILPGISLGGMKGPTLTNGELEEHVCTGEEFRRIKGNISPDLICLEVF
jgi:hypothetical protein